MGTQIPCIPIMPLAPGIHQFPTIHFFIRIQNSYHSLTIFYYFLIILIYLSILITYLFYIYYHISISFLYHFLKQYRKDIDIQ